MNKTLNLWLLVLAMFTQIACAQQAQTSEEAYKAEIKSLLDHTVPMLAISEYKVIKDEVVLLDARPEEEYNVSHIPGAIRIGYNDFDNDLADSIDKDKVLVVYCSVGYRSEKIGEKLLKKGFHNVANLYGSIFQWVNEGNEIEDLDGNTTKEIHTYNKSWGKWMMNPDYKKVY